MDANTLKSNEGDRLSDDKRGISQALEVFRDRAGRYRQTARLVLSDSLWRFRRRLAVLLLIAGASLVLQVAALGAFIFYARRLESGAGIDFAGMSIDPTRSIGLLAVAVVGGGLLFILSSWSRLYVERGFYDIAWRYGLFCSERTVALLSAALNGSGSGRLRLDEAEIREMTKSRPVLCGRVLNRLMSALPLAASLVVFSGILLYLDPVLTLLVAAIVLVSSALYYGLSVEASKLIPRRETEEREMGEDRRRLLDFVKRSNRALGREDPVLRRLVGQGSFSAFFAIRFQPQVLAARSMHVGNITLAVVLIVVGLVKGSKIITTGAGIGDLLVFLLAGRMAMTSVMGVMNGLVRVNLYYAKVADYFQTVKRLRDAEGGVVVEARPSSGRAVEIRAERLGAQSGAGAARVEPGERFALVTPRPLDRIALVEVIDGLRFHKAAEEGGGRRVTPALCWLVPEAPAPLPGASFAETIGLPEEFDSAALTSELQALQLPPEALSALPGDLAAPLRAEAWEGLDPRAIAGAGLVAAARAGHPLVAMSVKSLADIGENASRAVFERLLTDRVMLIAYRPPRAEKAGAYGESQLLLYDGEAVIGYLPVEEIDRHREILDGLAGRTHEKEDLAEDALLDDET